MTCTYNYSGTLAKGWIYYYNREGRYGFAWIGGRTVRFDLDVRFEAEGTADCPILTDQPRPQPPPWRPGIRTMVRILALTDLGENEPTAAAWCIIPARDQAEPARVWPLSA
jgi:hypothetical protein